MVRTRADNTARKAVAAKAPRKNFSAAGPSSNSTSPTGSKGNKFSGGNPYCPRPTPEWQKEITNFFIKKPKQTKSTGKENQDPEMDESGASSTSKNAAEDVPTSSKNAEASHVTREKEEEKAEEDKEADEEEKDEDDMMEVEIEIKDKKMEAAAGGSSKRKRESPRPFQKNNCISDSEDSDDN